MPVLRSDESARVEGGGVGGVPVVGEEYRLLERKVHEYMSRNQWT